MKDSGILKAHPEIQAFAHCRQCIAAMPLGQSPATWARIEVGLTPLGCVVWCLRHDVEIVTITLEDEPHDHPFVRRDTPETTHLS